MVQIAISQANQQYQLYQSIAQRPRKSKAQENTLQISPTSETQGKDTVSLRGSSEPSPQNINPPQETQEQNTSPASQVESQRNTSTQELSNQELQELQKLKSRDLEVRTHEQAHLAAAGGYSTGGPSFTFQTGPDGNQYAIAGEVPIDTGKESTPEQTIRKMRAIRRAALAPANPSAADRQIAAQAALLETQALLEKQQLSAIEGNVNEATSFVTPPTQGANETQSTIPATESRDSSVGNQKTTSIQRRQMMIDTYKMYASLG